MLGSMLVGFALSALQVPLLSPLPPAGLRPDPRDATVPRPVVRAPDVPADPKNPAEFLPELPTCKPSRVVGDLRFLARAEPGPVAVSPDGRLAACSSNRRISAPLAYHLLGSGQSHPTNGVRLFDASTGREVAELHGADWSGGKLRFSADSTQLYSGVGTLTVWDVPARRHVVTLSARDWSLTDDGQLLATLGREAVPVPAGKRQARGASPERWVVRVFDTATWAEAASYAVNGAWPRCLAISPDGNVLALGLEGGAVRAWDRRAARELPRRLDLPADFPPDAAPKNRSGSRYVAVDLLEFDPSGRWLAGAASRQADGANRVAVWPHPAGAPVRRLTTGGQVTALVFSPDSRLLGAFGHAARADGRAANAVLDLATGASVAQGLPPDPHYPQAAALAPDGRSVYLAARDQRLRRVGFPSLEPLPVCDPPPPDGPPELPFATDSPLPPAVPRGDPGVLVSSGGFVRQLNTLGGITQFNDAEEVVRVYERGRGCDYAVSPTGDRLAIRSSDPLKPDPKTDHVVRLLDLRTGTELGALKAYPRAGRVLRFSPDGKRLAILHQDGLVRIWNAAARKPLMALDPDAYPVPGLTWSKDGRYLVGGHDQSPSLVVWDTADAAKP